MKIEEYLDNLKKDYKSIEATEHLKVSGWESLVNRKRKVWPRNLAIICAVFIILLIGTYRATEASLPNEPLYNAKIITEQVTENVSGSNEIAINHRAEEIVKLSEKKNVDQKLLNQVINEYKKEIHKKEHKKK